MSPAQLTKYRVLLAQWRGVRKAAGKPHDDAARYALHERCIGRACSSKAFSNAEFDKVLAAMSAEIDPAGFAEQMRIQDSPDLRLEDFRNRCHDALAQIVGADQTHRRNYLRAIVRQVSYGRATDLAALSERQTQVVMGILEKRARTVEKERKAGAPVEAVEEVF
jgi:hypothetical protein